MQDYKKNYLLWKENVKEDEDLIKELKDMENDESKIEDSFYRNLAFGTGGLRGIIGLGSNRMNIYTVSKATQGLANYIKNNFPSDKQSVAIAYDSRIKSDIFSKRAASVLAANGIKVYIYKELMPTPCVSYAVRYLKCSAGIMVTASHNPSKYNGYKVYGQDGCQITTEAADIILNEIENVDIFNDILIKDFDECLKDNSIEYINDDVYTSFIEETKKQSLLDKEIDKNISIVYTPLNGTGLKPVLRVLQESGYTNVKVVPEQEKPDGNFPTCPYPNPEILEAMQLGIKFAKENDADLLMASDPDCDRVGIAVKNNDGEFELLTGNQTGLLLLDYICSRRIALNKMPKDPVFVKTIVTMDLAERIAKAYSVKTINVLTGFKFIGEQIALLEKQNKEDSYICGFEESYGYLTGTYVRDKDGVNAAFMIAEMFTYYKNQGISLLDKLNELFDKYGYCLNTLHSYEFPGSSGFEKMNNIMKSFRNDINTIGNKKIIETLDYKEGLDGLPKSDVIKFILEDNCSVVVRPSGTEPKLKTYISISAANKKLAEDLELVIKEDLEKYL